MATAQRSQIAEKIVCKSVRANVHTDSVYYPGPTHRKYGSIVATDRRVYLMWKGKEILDLTQALSLDVSKTVSGSAKVTTYIRDYNILIAIDTTVREYQISLHRDGVTADQINAMATAIVAMVQSIQPTTPLQHQIMSLVSDDEDDLDYDEDEEIDDSEE